MAGFLSAIWREWGRRRERGVVSRDGVPDGPLAGILIGTPYRDGYEIPAPRLSRVPMRAPLIDPVADGDVELDELARSAESGRPRWVADRGTTEAGSDVPST